MNKTRQGLSTAIGIVIFSAIVATQQPQAPAAPAAAPPPVAPAAGRGPITPGTESGWATFQTRCASCHGNQNVERAPSAVAIREMTPERIYAALATGSMQAQSQGLSDAQKKILAEFMSGRPTGSSAAGSAATMPNKCTTNPPMTDPAASGGGIASPAR